MGQDKAWLDWNGTPLLAHVVDQLVGTCDPLIIVGARDQALPATPQAIVVADPAEHPDEGPLRGLLTGLAVAAEAGRELAFLVGCDAPFVSGAHVRAVANAVGPEHQAAAPSSDGHLQVLSSVVRVTAALVTARALLDDGVRSLQALFRALPVAHVELQALPDPRALRTCNTPEELATLRELLPTADPGR